MKQTTTHTPGATGAETSVLSKISGERRENKSDFNAETGENQGNSCASQRQRILTWLQFRPLTTIEARGVLKIMHPAQRVHELRASGHLIGTGWRYDETEEQGRHRVGQYYLKVTGGENDAKI